MTSYDGNIGVSDTEEGPSKKKRRRIEAQESSDVSSSTSSPVVENSTVESPDVEQLLETGCSCKHRAYALRSCGNDTSANGTLYHSQNEGFTASALVHEKDKRRQLKDMGFSEENINAAVKACGIESEAIDLVEFIQAHFCINDPFLSMKNEACLPLPEGCTTDVLAHREDKRRSLQDMGFSEEHVDAAIKACGEESDTIDLVEFIQAYFCISEPLNSMENKVCLPLPETHISRSMTLEKELGRSHIDMGFTEEHITVGMKACGKDSSVEGALEYIQSADCVQDSYAQDSSSIMEEEMDSSEDEGSSGSTPLKKLINMGFSSAAIENAMETCESLDFEDLLNFLLEADSLYGDGCPAEDVGEILPHGSKASDKAGSSKAVSTSVKWTKDKIKLWYTYIGQKRDQFLDVHESSGKTPRCKRKSVFELKAGRKKKEVLKFEEEVIKPEKMRGFAMPGYFIGRPNPVPSTMIGPPFFYFENVASAPKFEWDTIKRHLHDVDIEYTDAKFFSATRRPRGYVHNLPIHGRKLIFPEPPMTIAEALPDTQKYWPPWDTREKLNCIHTVRASDKLCEMIRAFCIEHESAEMPFQRQQEILQAMKKWNLVWVGPGQAAPLEPHEIELLLGFEKDHTRGCSSMTDRYTALGNSFQINTVAYHLSPLRDLYPNGMTVLSLFSGIGGAEVALHKLGIRLKAVVSVEKNPKTKNVLASWWKKTGQRGQLISDYDDVKELSHTSLHRIMKDVGTIDLIIGGSPCNNLSGCNRATRTGLEGKHSSLFFEFPRILNIVKQIVAERSLK